MSHKIQLIRLVNALTRSQNINDQVIDTEEENMR